MRYDAWDQKRKRECHKTFPLHFFCHNDYASLGAPTGQTPAQAPQEIHVSASI